jgi:hypothetical protein
MRRAAPFLMTFAIAASAMATTASAQSGQAMRIPCHDATEIAKQLSKKYEEAPIAFGLQSNGNLLQIYTSETKHTWTVVSTTPSGKSCIVAAGKRWENIPFISADPMA